MTTTVLSPERVIEIVKSIGPDDPLSIARNIEQAVLQSEQVQAWKRDAERIQFFESQCGGDWLKLEDGNWIVDTGSKFGMGEGLRSAIDAAVENQK